MKTKNIGNLVRHWTVCTLALLSTSLWVPSVAIAQVTAAQTPLFLSSSADPNIMFVLDDSGSMHWEVTPDDYVLPYFTFRRIAGLYGGTDYTNYVASVRYNSANADESLTARSLRSFVVNKSYYNPATTYMPWARADGSLFPNAVPAAAFHHPIRTALGSRNLTVNTTENSIWLHRNTAGTAFCSISCTEVNAGNSLTHYPAVYFRHNGGDLVTAANFTQVNIISTTLLYTGDGRANRSDCVAGICTYAQEIQNFANWYTYYRSRMLSAQAGIGRAFSTQPETMRVGFGAINKASASIDNVNTRTVIRGVRPFSGTDRTAFFTELYDGVWAPSNTPLRRALDDVGQYYSRTDNRGPWGAIPGTNNSTAQLTCRQSYSILMTDGYWTDDVASQASTAAAQGNVDGTAGSTITDAGPPVQSYTYAASTPFTDGNSNTLADTAMHYWKRDLRTDLDNKVPVSSLNPAFWQHMVTYGVGLGVTGTVNPTTALAAITANPAVNINWPNPTATNAGKIDDLLHAGVNSRGGFFSAADPDTFATELTSVLSSIVARVTAAGTSAAASSATLQTDTLLYNASFRSSDWSGTLVARNLDDDGVPLPVSNPASLAWDAELLLSARTTTRNIITSNATGTPVTFNLASLSASQTAALGVNPTGAPTSTASAQDRINWLYGTESTQLRSRLVDGVTRRIGDIIGSSPQFLSRKDYGYTLLPAPQGTSYRAFRNGAGYLARPEALLVGSNDGMFHGFNAANGNELFAYIPSELLLPGTSGTHAQINDYMRTDYSHRFFVDGSAALSDVYTSGAWRTAAVGTMGAGGRTVFALDVTDPSSVGSADVMWEFKYANVACSADPTGAAGSRACRDIGYGVTAPKVVRLDSGRWAAVFGNGYNSYDNRARLLVVDMQTGRLLYNLLTPDNTTAGGSATASNPNGLSPVETTDWPSNALNLSNVFAGDLLGNVWRFSFQGTTPTIRRVYTAVDDASPAVRQPITAAPTVALKPGAPSEAVVLFGTGSFFRVGDDNTVSPQVQTFYGIFESATATGSAATRSDLLEQVITSNTAQVTIGTEVYPAGSLRYLTQNTLASGQRGWKVNLPSPGERVISKPIMPSGPVQQSVRFATLIPDDDPCGSGRQGFLMDMSILSGGRSSSPAFDVNNDGVIDSNDTSGGQAPSGVGGPTGEMPIIVREPDNGIDNIYGGDGSLIVKGSNTAGPVGRQSWRQLR